MWERRFPKIKDVIPLPNGVFHFMDYTFRAEITKDQLDFLLMASYGQRNPAPVIDLIYDEDEEETGARKLNDVELAKLAAMMLAYYKPRWDKLADVYDVEYDPIHNYLDEWEDEADGTHEDERVLDSDRVDTLGTTVTKSSTRTDNLSEQETRNLTNGNTKTYNNTDATTYGKSNLETDAFSIGTTHGKVDTKVTSNETDVKTGSETTQNSHDNTDQVKGFNSSNWVDTDHSSGAKANNESQTTYNSVTNTKNGTVTDTLSGTDTESHTGSITNTQSGTDSVRHTGTIDDSGTEGGTVNTTNTGTQEVSGSDATTGTNSRATDETETTDGSDHRERSGKHFGNIGNLTSQKMLKEEIELWKWNYVQSILEDARDFLTLPVYL